MCVALCYFEEVLKNMFVLDEKDKLDNPECEKLKNIFSDFSYFIEAVDYATFVLPVIPNKVFYKNDGKEFFLGNNKKESKGLKTNYFIKMEELKTAKEYLKEYLNSNNKQKRKIIRGY